MQLTTAFLSLQVFDMKKFQSNVNRELSRAYPDRRRLEMQCLSTLAFVKSEIDIIDCPIWVLIINVVAMDMLKSKLPPGESRRPPSKCR
jgi:MH2 domain